MKSAGQYSIYENTLNLPSVKVTNHIYDKGSLKTPIDREHAMLDGVVLDNKGQIIIKGQKFVKSS